MHAMCQFAHGKHELRKAPTEPQNLPTTPSFKPVSLYKTQLCKVHCKVHSFI